MTRPMTLSKLLYDVIITITTSVKDSASSPLLRLSDTL